MSLRWVLLLVLVAVILVAAAVITIVYLGWIPFLIFACGDILTGLIGFWWGAGRSGGRPYVIPPEVRRRHLP